MALAQITRLFGIDVGHRLLKHESKCRHVHGHRYGIEVTVAAEKLDEVGRVLDFSEIKSRVGNWLDDTWDHGFIAQEGDPIIEWLRANEMKHVIYPFPPTAENLVEYLATKALPHVLKGTPCHVTKVVLHETPNCTAEYVVG